MTRYLGKMFTAHLPAAFQNRQAKAVDIRGGFRGEKTAQNQHRAMNKILCFPDRYAVGYP